MAQVLTGTNQVKKNDGSIVTAQQGAWYDGKQFWNGTLSDPGVINSQSNQQGAGQKVSDEVNRASSIAQGKEPDAIKNYLATQTAKPTLSSQSSNNLGFSGTNTGGSTSGVGTGTGAGFTAPAPVDLVGQFKDLLKSSGIQEKETQLSQMEKDFIEAKGGVNDNPFLNEASRVGREAKLTKLFDERTANIRGEIATSRADAETQLNLQMKQFDINSQQAKDAMDQFNFLLSSGALNNASGEDIANITKATGLSSSIIYSAIDTTKKTAQNANSQVITSTDNNGNVTVTTIDKNTGEIMAQNSLGNIGGAKESSGPGSAKAGSAQFISENKSAVSTFLFSKANDYGHVSPSEWQQAQQAWITDGLGSRDEFISTFKNLTDPNRGDFESQSGYGFPLYVREE